MTKITNTYQCKSINELVQYYIDNPMILKHNKPHSVYSYIVHNDLFAFLSVLKKSTNTPSVHDLMLLRELSNYDIDSYPGSIRLETVNDILKVYKDRKDEQCHPKTEIY